MSKDKLTVGVNVLGFAVMGGLWGFFRGDPTAYIVPCVLAGYVVGALENIARRLDAPQQP